MNAIFHHLGYACLNFEKEIMSFSAMGYNPESIIYEDISLGIRCQFLSHDTAPRLELIADINGSNIVSPWIKSGNRIYHHAYFVDDLDEIKEHMKIYSARLIIPPKPALAFNGSKVCFYILPNLWMCEFIETKKEK